MKKLSIILVYCIIAMSAVAQTTGYLGHRFFISAGGSLVPDIRRIENSYSYYADEMTEPAVNFHFPLTGDINYVLSDALSIGAGVEFTNVKANFEGVSVEIPNITTSTYYFSGVKYKTGFYKVYLEGHRRFGYSIIDNYFRLGLSKAFFSNTSYYNTYMQSYNYYYNTIYVETELPDEYVVFRLNQKSSMTGLYYEFGNRVPLGNHLLMSYGISGFVFPTRNTVYESNSASLHNTMSNTFIIDLGKRRVGNGNLFSINASIVYAF